MSETKYHEQDNNLLKRKCEDNAESEFVCVEDESNDQEIGVKKPPMPTYGKYNILKILKENHCLIADEEQLQKAFPRKKIYTIEDIKSK